MQTAVRVGLLTVGLGLVGCGLFGKRSATPNSDDRPFLGATNPTAAGTAAAPPAPTPVNGILAGQVLDRFNRRQPGAFIQIVDLSVPQTGKPAKIEVATDGEGYFTIPGLKTACHYQLIARCKDGDKVLTGTALAMPPNPRLSIYVSDDLASPTTPPMPARPSIPGRGTEEKPSATIDPPVKGKPEASGTSSSPGVSVQPAVPVDPSKITQVEPGGFARLPTVSVPSPPFESPLPLVPRPPTAPQVDSTSMPFAPRSSPAPMIQLPGATPPVPYCLLLGRKLENFALYDLNGQPWEYRRDHKGRLILLDFWFSTCGSCLQAIPELIELRNRYRPGLEVIGIACESGKPAEQAQKARRVCARFNIPYTVLLAGGNPERCPVQSQFQVWSFPTLVLLDESGEILLRHEGLDVRTRQELEKLIKSRLGLPPR